MAIAIGEGLYSQTSKGFFPLISKGILIVLQDNFGRRFHYLRLSITEICNFRCNYCLPDGNDCDSSRNFLTLNEIETLVQAFARMGTSKIRITGGEPALRKDLLDIIGLCKQVPGIEKVALTTNGFNLKQQVQHYHQAGLDALNVSADSLDPKMFHAITGKDKLLDILDGIQQALALGIPRVKVNAVMLRQFNGHEMQTYLDWLKATPVTLRLIELMQTGNNKAFFEQNHIAGESIKQQLLQSGWQRMVPEKQAGPAQEFYHADYAGKIGLIMPYSKDFCNSCNRLRVSSYGKLHLCLFAEQGLDIRAYLTDGDVAGACEAIQAMLLDKTASHNLQQGFTGDTRHLAMLGG